MYTTDMRGKIMNSKTMNIVLMVIIALILVVYSGAEGIVGSH